MVTIRQPVLRPLADQMRGRMPRHLGAPVPGRWPALPSCPACAGAGSVTAAMRSSALSPGRKSAHHLSADLAQVIAATGTAEPDLAAALAVAAWHTIHLEAIRAILADEDPQR